MFHGRDSRVGHVVVCAAESVKSTRLAHIVGVLLLGHIILVDSHHVLKVVSFGAEVWPLSDPPTVLLDEHFLVLGNEAFLWLVVEASQNFALETLRRVVRVALSIEVL